MAWPPPVLPINRTNADPQQDTHPADHNALALAMNDTVGYVQSLGNPWRATQVVNATMPGAALGGAFQDVQLTGVIGNLGTYVLSGGHPAIQIDRSCMIAGTVNIQMAPAAADGGLLIQTVYAGQFTSQYTFPMVAGVALGVDLPVAMYASAGQHIYWQIAGLVSAQTFNGGQLRIFEAGTLGNSVRL